MHVWFCPRYITINDVAIFKNSQSCGGVLTTDAAKQTTTTELYEYGYVLSTNITSFSTFFFAKNTFSILPVGLLSFAGSKCNNDVCLLWTVENEQNFSHYEVEKSNNGTVFSSCTSSIARNTGGREQYNTVDIQPANGNNYYRLKMVNGDGSYSYSKIISVNFSKIGLVSLQPNPASDFVFVKGATGYEYIRVVDITGGVQIQKMIRHDIEELKIGHLSKGIYLVQLARNGEMISLQLIRQ
ncbi:MAG TPA: T9SS type A sorting domain-containing protein [Chitinophagaceae bacterium]|jgi:hypothetical protein|nr:T9SS type A sorting domain-containing protein [Chitinophagaceae bacterium]